MSLTLIELLNTLQLLDNIYLNVCEKLLFLTFG